VLQNFILKHVGTATQKGNAKDVQSSRFLARFLPRSGKSSTDNITQSVINKMFFQKDAKWCILLHFEFKTCIVKTLNTV
jgi:hypothetical protein